MYKAQEFGGTQFGEGVLSGASSDSGASPSIPPTGSAWGQSCATAGSSELSAL